MLHNAHPPAKRRTTTQRMEADPTHSTQQQHPHKYVNPTQTQDTMKHLPDKTLHTHTPQQTHKMGNFHLLISADKKNHQHLQTHRSQNHLQMQKHHLNSQNPSADHPPPHPMSPLFPA